MSFVMTRRLDVPTWRRIRLSWEGPRVTVPGNYLIFPPWPSTLDSSILCGNATDLTSPSSPLTIHLKGMPPSPPPLSEPSNGAPHGTTLSAQSSRAQGSADETTDAMTGTLIMMGAGEPVRVLGSSHRTLSSGPALGMVQPMTDEESGEGKRSLRLAVKRKVLHFTVRVSAGQGAYSVLTPTPLCSPLGSPSRWAPVSSPPSSHFLVKSGGRTSTRPISAPLSGGQRSSFSSWTLPSFVREGGDKPCSRTVLTLCLFLSSTPVIFSAAFLARYCMFPQVLPLTFKHSQKSMFLGTIPMGLITITSNICQLGTTSFDLGIWPTFIAVGLWFFCVALSTLVAIGVPWSIVTYQKEHRFEATTAALLLPVVPPITAAATGSVLTEHLLERHPTLAFTVWSISYMQLGIGLPLALMVRMRGEATSMVPLTLFRALWRIHTDPRPLPPASHLVQGAAP